MDAFETLADPDFAKRVGTVFGAFFAPTIASGLVNDYSPVEMLKEIPQEGYGVAEIVAAQYALSGDLRTDVQMGGGLYTADKLAERAGVKSTIQGAL
ncbi:hypothetical protein [Halomarina oriensis]|uniref:Uncharacterized protein n=1 Tax=Halomarina oriensis TaxID=671145 RepID=A0A6B0GGV1_9EURY|nr:hypothetical protein [Halomarina oriensis]MWG32971.1 hypothetical protein [Halomarina oriensis]